MRPGTPTGGFVFYTNETSLCTIEGIGIWGGYAEKGGAIYISDGADPTINNCFFSENSADYGGAIYLSHTTSDILSCTFAGNSAAMRSGAVDVHMGAQPRLAHCTFYANECVHGCHLGTRHSSHTVVQNCILSYGLLGAAAVCELEATFAFSCCDVYGNEGGDYTACLTGWEGHQENFSADPMFCNPVQDDFHLEEGSPCSEEMNPVCGLIGAWEVGCGQVGPTYTVLPDGSGDFPTIQAALDAADDWSTIGLGHGVFSGDGNRDLDFGGKTLTLTSLSGDPASCIIDCQGTESEPHRAAALDEAEGLGTLLQGITFRGGFVSGSGPAGQGGLLRVADGADVQVRRCHFLQSRATRGGAIACKDANLDLEECFFHEAHGLLQGGALALLGPSMLTATRLTIAECEAIEGSGIHISDGDAIPNLFRSILYGGRGGAAVECVGIPPITVACSNLYANEGGDWTGCIADQYGQSGNTSENPLFCDEQSGDFHLLPGAPGDPEVNTECGLVGCFEVGCTGTGPGEPFLVAPDGSGDFLSLQEAIDHVGNGGVIQLANGVYTGEGNRDLELSHKTLTIESEAGSPVSCIIDCQGHEAEPHGGFLVGHAYAAGLTLRHVTVRHAYRDAPGGAVAALGSTVRLEGCWFSDNTATQGGAFHGEGCDFVILDCRFPENAAEGAGGAGALEAGCELMLAGSSFTGNSAASGGGALQIVDNASTRIDSCSFQENACLWGSGGALTVRNGEDCEIEFSIFAANLAPMGGAICIDSSSVTMRSLTIAENAADSGAGLHVVAGESLLDHSVIAFSGYGSAVSCEGDYALAVTCSDLFGNAGGDWTGPIAWMEHVLGNLSADPLFCMQQGAFPYALQPGSPCAPGSPPNPECGLIGAWAVGCQDASGIAQTKPASASRVLLAAGRPNPFGHETTIGFSIPTALAGTRARLCLFDPQGRLVCTLVDAGLDAGLHEVRWDGRDGAGHPVAQGAYFYRLRVGDQSLTRRLVCLR